MGLVQPVHACELALGAERNQRDRPLADVAHGQHVARGVELHVLGLMAELDGGRHRERSEIDHRDGVIGGVRHCHLAEALRDRDLMRHLAHRDMRDHRIDARIDDRHVGGRPVGHEHVVREVVQRVYAWHRHGKHGERTEAR